MGLFDFTKGAYKDFKQALTGETDITSPKCGKSKLYMVDGIMQKTAVCPECHYNLEDEIRKMVDRILLVVDLLRHHQDC